MQRAKVSEGLRATITHGTLTISGVGTITKGSFKQELKNAYSGVVIKGAKDGSHINLPEDSSHLFSFSESGSYGRPYTGTITIPDKLDTSKVTDMSCMFWDAANANPDARK